MNERMEELFKKQPQLLQNLLDAIDGNQLILDALWKYTDGIDAQHRVLSMWAATDCKRVSDAIKDKPTDYQVGYTSSMDDLIELMKLNFL